MINKIETIIKNQKNFEAVEIETETIQPGFNESIIRQISALKEEPDWMLQYRLKALEHFKKMEIPKWSNFEVPDINLQEISFFSRPKKLSSLDEVDPKILEMFEKIGVPMHERNALAGVAVDVVLDSVSVKTTFQDKLSKMGIIFCSFGEALIKHPELVQKYFGSVVSHKDNYYAALNAAVFSDGTFVYIPPNTKCPMDLSTYFRINSQKTGQFERTLIVADKGSYVSYLEGCFLQNTPIWTPDGIKKIQEIKVNDNVFDGSGTPQKVNNLMIRKYSGDVYYIKHIGSQEDIKTTSEHPFCVIKKNKILLTHKKIKQSEPVWVNAKDLEVGDFIYMPKISFSKINLSLEEAQLFGFCLSEDIWQFNWAAVKNNEQVIESNSGFWIPITKISSSYEETLVYNFEVNKTNTYLAQGIAVHNCSAPQRKEIQLHSAVVEIVALENATVNYATVQNWYSGDENGEGGIYNFVTKRGECREDGSKISWVQIETGSAITWKYPSVILRGDNSVGEFFSVAISNHHQKADTGTKMIHLGNNTSSSILSKGISLGHGENAYRGLVKISPRALNAKNYTRCDNLIVGNDGFGYAIPTVDNQSKTSHVEHEAFISKISQEALFLCQLRGLTESQAVSVFVNGFCKEVIKKLPMEFSVEAHRLIDAVIE